MRKDHAFLLAVEVSRIFKFGPAVIYWKNVIACFININKYKYFIDILKRLFKIQTFGRILSLRMGF